MMKKNYSPFYLRTAFVVLLMLTFVRGWGQVETLACPAGTVVSNQMTFNTTNFTIIHAKGADANFASFTPWRVYTDNTVTFSGGAGVQRITSIVITATSNAYATAAAGGTFTVLSGTGAVTGSSSTTTATINVGGTDVKSIRLKPNAQSRWSSVTINFEAVSSCVAPSTQASSFSSSAITQTSATASWARGNGDNVLVVARAGGAVNEDPVSGTAYTANAAFGSGQQIGTGNYVVYNGAGTSVNLSALAAGTNYHFAVYEYNTTGTCYNNAELVGNFTTASSPTTSVTPTSLTGFTATTSTDSAQQSFSVSGANLGTVPIVVTPPTGYQISQTSGSGYSSTAITLAPTSGSVSATTIYIILKSNATPGVANGTVTVNNTGVSSDKTVSLSGAVTRVTRTSAATGNWNDTTTWVGGIAPTSSDNVIIANTHSVTITSAVNRDSGTATTVNATGTLATNAQYVNNGTTTINGIFQINAGGLSSGTNFVYGPAATLNLNYNPSVFFVVDNTVPAWPAVNGPFNVNLLQGGVVLNSGAARSIAGTFQNNGGVNNLQAALTLNGIAQINAAGYFFISPTYGNSSTLIYNSSRTAGSEWTGNTTTAGVGSPQNVSVINNHAVTMPNGPRALSGNLAISAGSSLSLDTTTVGSDLIIGGNWINAGVFSPNLRVVEFRGSSAQTITGATTFDYLKINNAAGLSLSASSAVTVNANLNFIAGKITLGANDLLTSSTATISGADLSKYVVTNSSGQLKKTVGSTAVTFPVGTATRYNPITLTNVGTSDIYGVILTAGTVPNANDATSTANVRWLISEAVSGGSNLTVVPQWNTADQGTNFAAGTQLYVGFYDGTTWSQNSATVAGTNPYTAVGAGSFSPAILSGTQYFAVGKDNSFACSASTVPYVQNFESAIIPAIPICTSIQNAGTGNNWGTVNNPGNGFSNKTLQYIYNSTSPANAWFYTNGINLVAGTSYRISYKYGNDDTTFTEKLKVMYGLAPTNLSMTNLLADHPSINTATPAISTVDFTPSSSGVYYFGFNAYSDADQFALYVDDISVIVSPSTLLVDGTSSATLAFGNHNIGNTVPTQSFILSGANLTGFPSNITVTSPNTAFQLSSDGGSTWGSTTTVTYFSANLSAQNILVKYIPTTCGAFSSGNITFSGGGVTVYPTVSLSGTATLAQPIATAGITLTPTSFLANWNAVAGATGYELEVSKSSTFGTLTSGVINEGFENATFPPTGWLTTGWSRSTNIGDFNTGLAAAVGNFNSGTLTTMVISNPASLSFFLGRSSNTTAKTLTVEVSTTSQTSGFTTIATFNHTNVPVSSYNQYSVDLSAYNNNATVYIRFVKTSGTTSPWRLDDVVINYSSQTPSFVTGYGPKIISGGSVISESVTNLEQNTQYYYRVRATDAACKSSDSNVILVTTLHDTTTYTGTPTNAWDHGEPVASVNAVINGDLSVAGHLTSKTLTINPVKILTISPNASFTTGDLINNGKLIVASDANFVQTEGSVNGGTGDATVKRIANIKRQDYVYWSSPVAGQKLKAFSPGTLNIRFLRYDEPTNKFVPVFAAADPTTETAVFGLGEGYAIRASNSHPANLQDWPGQFVGSPNNGNVEINLTAQGLGYNMVGNPYPSNINLSGSNGLFTLNSGKTTGTAYFWTNVNANIDPPVGQTYNQDNYALYNQSGSNPAANSLIEPTGVVKVGQAFIIQAIGDATLDIRNKMREAAAPSVFFDKNSPAERDRFWLRLTTPANDFNTTLIAYVPNATDDFEYGYDAAVFGQSSDAVYTKLNSQKLAIQGRQYPLNAKDKVAIGTNHFASGQYRLSVSKAEGSFANGQHIYLKDKLNNTLTDLTVGDYTFNAQAGTTENRFEIVYENDIVLGTDTTVRKNMIIYRNGEELIIKSYDKKITEVGLYDSAGRLLTQLKPNAVRVRIDISSLANAFYVLKINQNGIITSRKIIK